MPSLGSHVARLALRTWMKPQLARRELSLAEVERVRERIARRYGRRRMPSDVRVAASIVGGRPAEVSSPVGYPTDDRVVLYLHGGAFLVGSPTMYRKLAVRLARAMRAPVVVPAYRLAPEHPWPAAPTDAFAAYRGLLDAGRDPRRIAVIGDSAGGNLVLTLLQQLRDAGLPMPASASCLSPWADLTHSGETIRSHADLDPMLPAHRLPAAARAYAPEHDLAHPLVSPVFADFAGFPPLLVQVGSHEVLLDDARRVVAAAQRHGVSATLRIWDGQPHVFQMLAHVIPEGRAAIEELGGFVLRHWPARAGERVAEEPSFDVPLPVGHGLSV
jgi:acetyl esterase/lipase